MQFYLINMHFLYSISRHGCALQWPTGTPKSYCGLSRTPGSIHILPITRHVA